MTGTMTGLAVIAALVCLFVSDWLYRSTVSRAKPLLPPSFREERRANFALGGFIWEPTLPDALRRRYLLSIVFGALAGLCVTVFAYSTGHHNWAAVFAALLLLAIWHGLSGLMKYRHLRAAPPA